MLFSGLWRLLNITLSRWVILIVKGGSTKGQTSGSNAPVGSVYIPMFFTSPGWHQAGRGQGPGTLWIKTSHRLYPVLPLRLFSLHWSFWALSTWKGFCLFIEGEHILSKRTSLPLSSFSVSRAHTAFISSDWSHKNSTFWATQRGHQGWFWLF